MAVSVKKTAVLVVMPCTLKVEKIGSAPVRLHCVTSHMTLLFNTAKIGCINIAKTHVEVFFVIL